MHARIVRLYSSICTREELPLSDAIPTSMIRGDGRSRKDDSRIQARHQEEPLTILECGNEDLHNGLEVFLCMQ